jgi:GNAT superfamily N-acetyltransferase
MRASELVEKWSKKYKSSIDCNNPKGFSQRAHCAGRKKNESVDEAINMDIANPGFYHEQQIGKYLYRAKYWNSGLKIYAYDGAKKIGYAELMYTPLPSDKRELRQFAKDTWLESEWTEVDPKYQRQGIMSTMYAYAKMLGNSVQPSSIRTDDAKAAWKSWGRDARHLTREDTAEGVLAESINNFKQVHAVLRDFLPVAMSELKIKELPKIHIKKNLDNNGQPSFGSFNGSNITLAVSGRHPIDICRTLAHELTHYKQGTNNQLDHESGETGSPEENEANSVAGIIMRKFSQQYPDYIGNRKNQ